ncbi:mucin-5AC-like [Lingula anatina]|uniref:Mucin-5AC-like n=1 Tax=Lingula anatina TaxID=7574 RepID=A0A1S3HKR5_LINAN|nr:mucin-5AC-like [Lingula anatina]|eukprot:XP_013385599.1 mucin-5AC-like [Lingula anatina]
MDAWKTFLAVIFLCTALAQTQDGSATTAATTTTATTSTTTVPGTSGKTASNTTTTSATRRTTISSILSPKNLPKSEVSSVPTVTAGSPSTVAAMTESSTTELSRNETERCLNEKLPGTQRWQSNMEGSSVTVEWGYGPETCSTLASCTGLPVVDDIDLPPQMIPREIQTGVTLNFISSRKPGQSFAMQPIYVTEDNFNECVTEGGTPVIAEPTHSVFQVDRQFLQPGNNYFIVQTSDPLFQCDFGLRLNVTVKTQNCVKTETFNSILDYYIKKYIQSGLICPYHEFGSTAS